MLTIKQENLFKAIASTQLFADELKDIKKDHGPMSSYTEEADQMLQQVQEMEKKLQLMFDSLD